MRRFRFRLETLLRVRNMAEQQAQAALSEAERGVASAERALTQILQEREQHRAYYARLQEQRTPDMALITASCQYTDIIEESLEAQRQQVRLALELRDTRRDALKHCRQECEVLEKLKSKKHQQHQQEAAAEEQAWLDEVAILRLSRA
ncbi:flagellar export protein FliJ [Armatimonas sp.]|uniref:flagellar export protein FliJ n=1 Tax=Armatimonas sp. TaxID=1872638 RepID=UPI00286C8D59|nr:flagellar export protein FliJ [Armatimonas sp.]